MIIDLSHFLVDNETVYTFSFDFENGDIRELDDSIIIHPLTLVGEIYKADKDLILTIKGSYLYKSICDRCLIKTEKNINFKSSAKLEKKGTENTEDIDDAEDIIYYSDTKVNLLEYVWNQILSSLPMKNLCNENCKGLCPVCGIDLNKDDCKCEIETGNLQFQKLRELSLDD
ncbi:MAG: DUF177 domain-containing protein [Gudongella sp.]|nr:DUF177 domain-containing protein [Gudongella sp.]